MKSLQNAKEDRERFMNSFGYNYKLKASEKKQLEFLNMVVLYLETDPTKEYLNKELLRVITLNSQLSERFNEWNTNTPNPKQKARSGRVKQFESQTGISLLNKQEKTIRYILG